MSKIVVRDIRVRDLQPELTQGLDAGPEDVVRVTVDADRGRLIDQLLALVDRMGAEAERQGRTDEKLAKLLDRK